MKVKEVKTSPPQSNVKSKKIFSKNNQMDTNIIQITKNVKDNKSKESSNIKAQLSDIKDDLILLTDINNTKRDESIIPLEKNSNFCHHDQLLNTERQNLTSKVHKIDPSTTTTQGVVTNLQKLEEEIINEQIILSHYQKSASDLTPQPLNQEIITNAKSREVQLLKNSENKIKESLYKLTQNQQLLENDSYINISNSKVDCNIRHNKLKQIKEQKESLYNKLEGINLQVSKIISDENNQVRRTKVQQFLNEFENHKEDYESKQQLYQKQSNLLKEKHKQEMSTAYEKHLKKLEMMEKSSIEKKEKFITEHRLKEREIIEKRKREINIQMEKTKKYIHERYRKNEKDFLFENYKEKYLLEEKRFHDKIKLQKKDQIVSKKEWMEMCHKIRSNRIMIEQEAKDKKGIMKEMWKNRSQLLPTYKSKSLIILKEEQSAQKAQEEMKDFQKKKFQKDGIIFANKNVPLPQVNRKLQRERVNRIIRITNKQKMKSLMRRRKNDKYKVPDPALLPKYSPKIPQSHSTFITQPLKKPLHLPDYLTEIKRRRQNSISPSLQYNWDKMLNDKNGSIAENVSIVKEKVNLLDEKVLKHKQLMNLHGGYSKKPELGEELGNLLANSIKAKLMIINKINSNTIQ